MSRLPPLSSWSLRPSSVTGCCLLALLLLESCGGGEALILPGDGQPAVIAVVKGDDQSGTVGEPLAAPLVVEVTDARGRAVEGAPVIIEFTSAGPGASVIPDTTETNAAGLAEARLVLGTSIGLQTGRARVVAAEGREPVTTTFTARALSESANRMAAMAGQDQTGHVGLPLDDQLVVEVTDGFGNPVEGVPISWAAEGGGSVSADVVETGEDGRARVERILGPSLGRQATLATSAGLSGSPVIFDHTAIAGDASRLVVVAGNGQTAAAGSTLPIDLVVQLVDADGNGVPRTPLSWVIATGGGTPAPVNAVTDDEGLATTSWTLGDALGEQRIDAVVSGVGFISFRATATAGAPASLFIQTQPSSSAGNGVPFGRQPVIQVRDARGNDVAAAGIPVRAAIASGGGELRGNLVRATDAFGRATFADLAISGDAGTRTLSFSAEGHAGVTSNEIAVGAPQNQAPSASYTRGCTNLTCAFNSDGSSDPDGTIVGWRWTFGDGGTSDARNPTYTYGGAGTYQVTLTVTDDDGATHSFTQPVTVAGPPPPQNRPPEADFNWHCVGLRCDFVDRSTDSDGDVVSWSWNFGDNTGSSEKNPSHTYASAGVYKVTLTVTDNAGASSISNDDVDPEAQSLRVQRQPSETAAMGVPFDRQPEIELRAGDEDIEQADVVVTASIASGAGTLGGTSTATTDEDGNAEFSNLSIGGASGPHTLKFSAPGFGEVISGTIQVGRASSTTTITSDEPDPSTAGTEFIVSFQVTGAGPTPTGSMTVTVSGGTPTCTADLSGGTGSCPMTLNNVGDRTLTANYSGDGFYAGSSGQASHRVNAPPTAQFTSPSCTTGVPCQFNDASGDTDGSVVAWSWDFDAGADSTQENPSHIFSAAGNLPVTLTVTDNNGATGSVTHSVTVSDPAPAGLRMLNLRTEPSSPTESGKELDPQPEVELLTDTRQEIKE